MRFDSTIQPQVRKAKLSVGSGPAVAVVYDPGRELVWGYRGMGVWVYGGMGIGKENRNRNRNRNRKSE